MNDVFIKNCYSKAQKRRALKANKKSVAVPQVVTKRKLYATLPFIANVTDKIGRILNKYDIQTSYKSNLKIRDLLGNVKDIVPLHCSGIYKIPCQCGKVYIGQTGRTVSKKLKEHERHIRLNQPGKSAVAEHAIQELHGIDFKNTKILARENNWMGRLIREAIEIKKSSNNVNLDTGYELNKSWLPVIHS